MEHIVYPDIFIDEIVNKIDNEKNLYIYIEVPNNKNTSNVEGCLAMLIPEHIYLMSHNGLISLVDKNQICIKTYEYKTQRGHCSIVNFSKRKKFNV